MEAELDSLCAAGAAVEAARLEKLVGAARERLTVELRRLIELQTAFDGVLANLSSDASPENALRSDALAPSVCVAAHLGGGLERLLAACEAARTRVPRATTPLAIAPTGPISAGGPSLVPVPAPTLSAMSRRIGSNAVSRPSTRGSAGCMVSVHSSGSIRPSAVPSRDSTRPPSRAVGSRGVEGPAALGEMEPVGFVDLDTADEMLASATATMAAREEHEERGPVRAP